jgi:hypothetical protein
LNPTTGAVVTDVGALTDAAGNPYGMTGLRFDPKTGVLYGSTSFNSATSAGHLVTINPTTARVTDIGSFGIAGSNTLSDITFDPVTEILYGNSGGNPNFFRVNLTTGAATVIGPTGVGVTFGGGLATDSLGTIYGSPQPGPGSLFTYNKTTGAATAVAPLTGAPFSGDIDAMAFDASGLLYGLEINTNIASRPVHLLIINQTTGVITDVGVTRNRLDGLDFQPNAVPEPASLALLALGLAGLAFGRRKKA